MPKVMTVILSQEEYDAMSVMPETTPEEWAQHAVSNKARKMIDALVVSYTDRNPDKMTKAEKAVVIPTIDLDAERNKRRGK